MVRDSVNKPDGRKPTEAGQPHDHERDLAHCLGEYLDRLVAGDVADMQDFLKEYSHVTPELAQELETLDVISTVVGKKSGPSRNRSSTSRCFPPIGGNSLA